MRAFVGILIAFLGGLLLLFTYAFASMIDPSLDDAEWRSALLFKMFLQGDIATGTYLGIGLVVGGLMLVLVKRSGAHTEGRPLTSRVSIAWAIAITLVLMFACYVGLS